VSVLDLFAWMVPIVLVANTIFVVVFLAILPGRIAKRRNHPWAQAVTVAGWVTLFLGFALWPVALIWGLCRYSGAADERSGAMIVVLLNVYLALLFVLVWTNIIRFTLFWKVSPVIVLLLLLVGLFIPMGWGAPQGAAVVVRQSVAIVPDVAGEVTEVLVTPNTPLKAGHVLFRIDPVPYASQLDAL
jgi:multidrug efflux pump subunit AcrA (membrane-fusion protein)